MCAAIVIATGPALADEPPATKSPETVEKVVVTASPLPRSTDKFSKIITTVRRDEALKNGGPSIGDALMKVPGVSGSGFAPGANRPVIRGFDATRVLVTENGIGSLDVAEIGPDHGTPVDMLSIDRIEVVRGPGTLRYGSQATGGIVNVITGRIPDRRFEGLRADIAGIYGSAANAGDGAISASYGEGVFAFHADGFLRNAGDYDTPDGRQLNSFARMNGYALGAALRGEEGSVGGAFIEYNGKYGLPAGDTFIDVHQEKWLARGIWNAKGGALERIQLEGGYADYEHSEVEPGGIIGATFLNQEFDGRAEAIFGEIGPSSGSALGLQYQHREFSGLGEAEDYLLPATAEGVGIYAFSRIPLGKTVDMEGSMRVEFASREGVPISDVPTSKDFTPFSASAGLVWKATEKTTLGVTLSRTARVPGLPEMFARGPHDGPSTFEVGDPTLGLEKATSLEGTARYEAQGLSLSGALWGSWYDGFIFGQLTGRTCDEAGVCVAGPGEELKEMFFVQRDANFWGFEAEARYELAKIDEFAIGVTAQVDFVRGRLSGGENVPRLPPLRYGPGLFLESEKLNAGLQVFRVSEQDRPGAFDTPTKGYTDVSADLTWRCWEEEGRAFDISLVGRNLTDQRERNASSFVKDDVLMPGRDIRVVGRFSF
jgi:iron complex outermembrane receptor protein